VSVHLNTITMNLHPDGLRWQRFTGVMIGSRILGVFRNCDIDNESALAEYDRTWGPRSAPLPVTDEMHELEMRGALW
jgi:hypothetical protein